MLRSQKHKQSWLSKTQHSKKKKFKKIIPDHVFILVSFLYDYYEHDTTLSKQITHAEVAVKKNKILCTLL